MMDYQTPLGFDKRNDRAAYGALTCTKYNSKTTGTERKCYIYTPASYDPAVTYPVLYLLHGIGGIETEWLAGAPNEILSNLIALDLLPPMMAVIPNVRAMKNDSIPPEILGEENINAFDNFICDLRDDLMPFIERNYPVSAAREGRAIAGLSMGGREALYIGLSMPDAFGYIGAFSPAPGLLPVAALRYPGQFTWGQMTLPAAYRDNTFILICSGNQDDVVGDIPYEYHRALKENGVRHVFYMVDGGHDFGVWKNGLYHFARYIFHN